MGAAMARRRGVAAQPPDDVDLAKRLADLGPEVRRDKRRDGAGRTHKGFRPDPENPNRLVYGARTSPPHHQLLLRRRLTPWAFEAGEKYAAYWQTREVGGSPDPDAPRVRRKAWERAGEMQADQVLASARLREAADVLGPLAENVVRLVCVAEQPLYAAFGHLYPHLADDKGPSRPVRSAVVQGMLVVALEALARRWRLGPRRPGGPRARVPAAAPAIPPQDGSEG